jgi:hypothetical protein
MSAWQDLVTASLIGTERAPVPASLVPGLPPAEGTTQDPAAVLLDRAALLTAARRAGRRPDQAEPPPVCEPDPRPAVSRAAGRRLARMLGGEHLDLLPEWLNAVATRGLQPPLQLLPALLDRARRGGPADWDLPRLVAEAGGPRARWLAGLNPDWQFVLAETPNGDEAWRLGTASQRRAYLTALRARDPGAARELIAGSWAAAGADERVMFVKVMMRGLSLADEPLLEAAGDDGAASVRKMAADVLTALPGSALSRRIAQVAVGRLRLEQDGRGPRLVYVPPTASDAALQRDGITPSLDAAGSGLAPTIGMTFHIVARTQLRTWTQEFGMPASLIVALPAGQWAPSLFIAWSTAALWQHDPDWMAALIGQALAGRPPKTAAEIQALDKLVRRADPALGAPDSLPAPRPDASPAVGGALSVLRFRYEMLKELAHDHGDG